MKNPKYILKIFKKSKKYFQNNQYEGKIMKHDRDIFIFMKKVRISYSKIKHIVFDKNSLCQNSNSF
jgi:hypothetical protein